jgi:DNA (cytosine-5)-methyltransferase 1
MKFGSVCSGIEAASVAWTPLGWQAAWLAEIEKFPCEVLKHHYPDVPNLGDMTKLPDMILSGQVEAPDLFCGGTPCQAFSVAGLRQSLDDARGNLSLTFCEIANAIDQVRSVQQSDPCIVFWENVPGVLNTKDNAFGCFLGALAGEDDALIAPRGRWTNAGFIDGPQRAVAWRVLDAQYFGVAQRRRRVFVVASARDDFDPAAVLFEFDGVRRDIAPSREAGERVAPCVTNGPPFSRTGNERVECEAIITMAHGQGGAEIGVNRGPTLTCNHEAPIAAYAIQGSMIGRNDHAGPQGNGVNIEVCFTQNTIDRHAVAQPLPFDTTQITSKANYSKPQSGDPCHPLAAGAHAPAIAVGTDLYNGAITGDIAVPMTNRADGTGTGPTVMQAMAVRRLTPTECERLQGFPDGYTNIKDKCPDGSRYKALGNSWAVPVVRWIGERINRALG